MNINNIITAVRSSQLELPDVDDDNDNNNKIGNGKGFSPIKNNKNNNLYNKLDQTIDNNNNDTNNNNNNIDNPPSDKRKEPKKNSVFQFPNNNDNGANNDNNKNKRMFSLQSVIKSAKHSSENEEIISSTSSSKIIKNQEENEKEDNKLIKRKNGKKKKQPFKLDKVIHRVKTVHQSPTDFKTNTTNKFEEKAEDVGDIGHQYHIINDKKQLKTYNNNNNDYMWQECLTCLRGIGSICSTMIQLCGRCFSICKVVSLEQQNVLRHELENGAFLPPHALEINQDAVNKFLQRHVGDAVLAITIRKCDLLQPDVNIIHPMIRIHIVDYVSGKYLEKTDKLRPAIIPNEYERHGNFTEMTSHILPILTHPCNLNNIGTFQPNWNELLLINEDLKHFVSKDWGPRVLILFELLDFGAQIDLNEYIDGYYPIAWGFLKLMSTKGKPNVGDLRLQLYKYINTIPKSKQSLVPPVYYQWVYQKNLGRQLYSSTLHINIKGISKPKHRVVTHRAILPTDQEIGRIDYEEMSRGLDSTDENSYNLSERQWSQLSQNERETLLRYRRKTDDCVVPNRLMHEISCGYQGCFRLSFSPNGKILATACGDQLLFTIKLFDVTSGTHIGTFQGHHEIIHDLNWSSNGHELVSSSSDLTAKIWDTKRMRPLAIKSLQHTSYVYTAKFHPRAPLIVTGAFDGGIYVWHRKTAHQLVVLNAHKSHVNSIVFSKSGAQFFSGDANGIINVWDDLVRPIKRNNLYNNNNNNSDDDDDDDNDINNQDNNINSWKDRFSNTRTLKIPQINGEIINSISYHHRPEMLAVYCRNNAIFIISLRRYDIQARLSGAKCTIHPLRCTFSPDGKMIVAGSEDGKAYFWRINNSESPYKIINTNYRQPLYDIVWHPTQHIVAMSCFGGDYPILLYDAIDTVKLKI